MMPEKKSTNVYDDGNIPNVDLPQDKMNSKNTEQNMPDSVEPLPESTRPRKDGPGGA